jgi:hypothetical protein
MSEPTSNWTVADTVAVETGTFTHVRRATH